MVLVKVSAAVVLPSQSNQYMDEPVPGYGPPHPKAPGVRCECVHPACS